MASTLKQRLQTIFMAGFFIFMVASPVMAVASPVVSSASAACDDRVLGVPPWYRGLTDGDCSIKSPEEVGGIQPFIWTIVLNVIEMALVIVVYISVFFVLYGGFQLIAGGYSPETVSRGRKTITNALIGLVIAMAAIAITNLIFSVIPK